MYFNRLIFRSLWHYRRRNLTVALGMAIGMAVITGALVTGDSVRSGLQNLVGIRLGDVDLSVSAGDRYITDSLAYRVSAELGIPANAVLQLEGSVTAGGGTKRLPKVQVFGVEQAFRTIVGPGTFDPPLNDNEAVISDDLAARLDVREGDEILIRINKPGPVPIDAPFVSDQENIIAARVSVKSIAGKYLHGRFHLQNTQSAPFNVFICKKYLQKLAGLEGLSNLIIMAGKGKVPASQAEKALASSRTLRDASLYIEKHPATGEWILRTPRVFFDLPTLSAIESLTSDKTLWFSYFVNEFRTGNRTTPYSFVSTLPGDQVQPGEIMISRWLAEDLAAGIGDSVTLSYFVVGPLRNLTVEKARFRITGIIPMDDQRCDRFLMPEIHGLSDAGNCRDWETSIPIDLEKIRDKDEGYWNQYKGTPKAFINPYQAAGLWQNRFGKYTQIRFSPGTGFSDIESGILSHLRPSDTGIIVREPAREGLTAATSGVDFSGLFLGLSFFLVAGGIILTILLIRLGLDGRLTQIGTLRALGWPEHRIRQMLLWENSFVSCFGALIGLMLTFIYTIVIFKALNGVWNDIILTDTLRPVFKPVTLAAGMAISILVSFGSSWLALRHLFHHKTVALQHRSKTLDSRRYKLHLTLFSATTGLWALVMLVFGLIRIQSVSPTFFFTAGTLLLLSLILLAIRMFRHSPPATNRNFSLGSFARSNLWRNSGRSLSVILLFAIGIFMVMAIGANRKAVEGTHPLPPYLKKGGGTSSDLPSEPGPSLGSGRGWGGYLHTGTGGFLFYLETTVPVPDNLNNPLVRSKYGLENSSEFVQMKKLQGDDASCLNLNRVSNPPLLGVPPEAFEGRFRFASLIDEKYLADPWKILEKVLPDGVIPAVADQTVIQWGLGLKIGDTLKYKSETGDTVKIVLVGGLTNSVFQGNIMIPEKLFLKYWPSVSGTNIMLILADHTDIEPIRSELMSVFRDYGADLKPAAEKLAEFNSVENTYLSIFLVMGALAMLLGTIGLAIILARNLQERQAEIALLRATGFSRQRILWLVVLEYSALLLYGTLAGGISSLVSVLPGLLNPAGEVSPLFLISILLILLLNGFAWILILGWNSVKKPGIIESLRTE
ncbi:MAG: FtsX-like permease family protein [Bacteroidia bacterium]|nr:FtsX-like permease family protein [Bacteroidia bacterium]